MVYMNAFAKIMTIIAGIIIIVSCIKTPPDKWTKDYYAYQMGAIINGQEFHEARDYYYGSSYGFLKIEIVGKDSSTVWYVSWDGVGKAFYSNPRKNGSFYYFHFHLLFVKELNKDLCLSFLALPQDLEFNVILSSDSLYCGIPLVQGDLVNNLSHYQIKEGTIKLGAFNSTDNGWPVNSDTVTFSFIAENDSGERLVVENGYCKAYSLLGVYE